MTYQPFFPLNLDAVCVGDGGRYHQLMMPIRPVKVPSSANSQRHPASPLNPRICRIPNARNAETIEVAWYATQKKLSRIAAKFDGDD